MLPGRGGARTALDILELLAGLPDELSEPRDNNAERALLLELLGFFSSLSSKSLHLANSCFMFS